MSLETKPPNRMTSEDQDRLLKNAAAEKEVIKEAIREWMDEKYAIVGKWTVGAFGVALTGALVYFVMVFSGWHR